MKAGEYLLNTTYCLFLSKDGELYRVRNMQLGHFFAELLRQEVDLVLVGLK